jgi:tetratricopeptide (TPR) repeat protein
MRPDEGRVGGSGVSDGGRGTGWNRLLGFLVLAAVLAVSVLSCAATRPYGAQPAETEPERAQLSPEAFHYFTTGNFLAAGGDDSSAVSQYRQALTYDPGSREIKLALARAYARMGRFEEAAITTESVRPRDPEVLGLLAELYSRMRNGVRRQAVFEEWSRVDSTDVQVWQFLANSYQSAGDTLGQARALSRLAVLAPDPAVFEQLGMILLAQGRPDSAEIWFRQALAADSGQKATRVMLGMAQSFADRSQPDSAKLYYQRAVDLNYYNTELRKRYFYYLLQAPETRPDALEQGRLVLKLSAAEPDVLYRVAVLEFDLQQRDSAEVHLTRWVAEFGEDGVAHFLLGRIALEKADSTTAEAQFVQAIAVADTLVEPYLSLAFLYNRRQERDSALAVYGAGLVHLPGHPDLLFGQGATLEQMGQFDAAVEVFEGLLAKHPRYAPALNYLGYLWADKGVRLDEALDLIERAIAIQPDNGAYIDSHAWVLYRLGRLQEAEAKMREALALIDDDAVVFDHYGDILAQLGRAEEARQNWQRALSLDPNNAAIQNKLAR